MRICIIAEGCYPYIVGGVSEWLNGLIHSYPGHEFVILSIVADRSMRGKYVYEIPENVAEIHELYLNDSDWGKKRARRRVRMNKKEYQALLSLLLGEEIKWELLFDFFQKSGISLNDMLMGPDFLNAVTEYYKLNYNQMVFADFLWMLRSIYLPLFMALRMKIPKADIYHCTCTGYAGVLGSMAKYMHGGRLLISEHGVYTREREEELIKAKWVQGIYKNIWIEQFHKMSALAYDRADVVTCLYKHAKELQTDLGCDPNKIRIVPNGIEVEKFQNLPGKTEDEKEYINIGAVVRVAPIKDIMTMIQAFGFAKEMEPSLKLWIMGTYEEEDEYAKDCYELVRIMGISDVVFTGRVDVTEYYGKMDMLILTSISEGQPLTILEGFAARKPVIATDVGNCRELILGENDDYGEAGIVTRIMHVEEIARAILTLAHDEALRSRMGENGLRRVVSGYRFEYLQDAYRDLYEELAGEEETNGTESGGMEEWQA